MARLPFELSDYIIDFLHNDAKALKACALTCQAWVPAARFHLFRTIVLKTANSTTAFRRLLDKSPSLGLYVRELTAEKLADTVAVPVTEQPTHEPVQHTLPLAFAHIPSLQTLSLSHLDLKCLVDIRGLAHASVSTLTLSYCQFTELADVVDLVSSFPRLVSLSMSGLTWKDEERVPAPIATPTLRSLQLGREMESEKLFEWLQAASFHESLASLSARCASEREADLLGAYLKLAGPSLRSFSLDWSVTGDKTIILPDNMSLGGCAALEDLTLIFPVHFSTSLPWVTSILATLDATALRTVSCEIRLLGSIDALDWDGLIAIFSSEAYRSLRTLKFKVNVWPGVHKDFAEVEAIIRARLGAFDRKGMVHVCKA
ncbi:hypothetical protein BD309DRAFT_349032 [Dichomitus squalens]|nr:hypothetical protein BD309DRAFT_349032 [Dichomitus squalens]